MKKLVIVVSLFLATEVYALSGTARLVKCELGSKNGQYIGTYELKGTTFQMLFENHSRCPNIVQIYGE